MRHWIGWSVALALGCAGPSGPGGVVTDSGVPDSTDVIQLGLGELWTHAAWGRRVLLTSAVGGAVLDVPEGMSAELGGDGAWVDLRWTPDATGAWTGTVLFESGCIELAATVMDKPEGVRSPVHIGWDVLDMVEATGHGDASFAEDDRVPWLDDGHAGEFWWGAPTQGRAWRVDSSTTTQAGDCGAQQTLNNTGSGTSRPLASRPWRPPTRTAPVRA